MLRVVPTIVLAAGAVLAGIGMLPAAQATPQQRARSAAEIAASRENMRPATPATSQATTTASDRKPADAGSDGPPATKQQDKQQDDKQHEDEQESREQQQADAQFRRMDRNGDGTVSLDEYSGWSREQFDAKDRDRNYYLSPGERKAGGSTPGQLGGDSGIADDHDQSISDNARDAEAAFRAADGNGDGQLDRAELEQGSGHAPNREPDGQR